MIRRLLLGRRCVLCGGMLGLTDGERARLCPDCAAAVRREYRCPHGRAVDYCAQTDSALWYKGKVRRAMLRVKFYHRTGALRWFAGQTAARLLANQDSWQPDLVTFVPMAAPRRWARGYNQSAVFAREAAAKCGLPCVDCLRRGLFSRRQSRMETPADRRRNAARGFAARKGVRLDGKRVVLVDDILTTGATAEACARLLLGMGAAEVCLLTATRVP